MYEYDYNDEFKELIQKKNNKDYIKAKRLVIKKNFCFIPQFSKSKDINFTYYGHAIKMKNNRNIYILGKIILLLKKNLKNNQKI